MVYLLKDDRTSNNTTEDKTIKRYWHIFGGILHVWMGYVMEQAYGNGIGLFTGAIMWIFFDGAINSMVLRKEWWYVGSTAWIDIAQQQLGKWIHTDPRLVSAILKLSTLVVAIINMWIN